MYEQNIRIGCGLRGDKIRGFRDSRLQQSVTNSSIFFGGENVRANGKIIVVAINQLEGQHDGSRRLTYYSQLCRRGGPRPRGRGGDSDRGGGPRLQQLR